MLGRRGRVTVRCGTAAGSKRALPTRGRWSATLRLPRRCAGAGRARVSGLTGGEALNRALEHGPEALRDSAIVNDALRGQAPRDLSRMIEGIARTSRGLAADEQALADLVSNFNTAMASMAAKAPELEETVALLGPTMASARRGFDSIGRALPPSRAFAREILPGVRETPATLAAAFPWLDQAKEFFGPSELGGFLDEMAPATGDLAGLTRASRELMPDVDRFNRCVLEVLIPTGNIRVDDGAHSAGVENYKEFWYAMVGQAGEGQSFDGNGPFLRLAAPGGVNAIETGKTNYTGVSVFGNYANPPLETRPAFPGTVPPLRRDRPCHRNPVPDVNGPGLARAGGRVGARTRRRRPCRRCRACRHRRRSSGRSRAFSRGPHDEAEAAEGAPLQPRRGDRAGRIVLLGSVVGGYILSNQRLNPPAWVPVVGESHFELRAELETVQGILPGQGQAVNISGRPGGRHREHRARGGQGGRHDADRGALRADLPGRHGPAAAEDQREGHGRRARARARPTPGRGSRAAPSSTNASTLADVNFADFLSSLDADTQDFLRMLLQGGGEALGDGGGRDLANTFRRFPPLARQRREGVAARRAPPRSARAGDGQLLEDHERARAPRPGAVALRRAAATRSSALREPEREPGRDDRAAARRARLDRPGAGPRRPAGAGDGVGLRRPAAHGARARAVAEPAAAVPARHRAADPRRAPALHARGAADRPRAARAGRTISPPRCRRSAGSRTC